MIITDHKCIPCNITGWWFHPIPKILVNWDDYPQYMGKYKMFQTTNQYNIQYSLIVSCSFHWRPEKHKEKHHPSSPCLGQCQKPPVAQGQLVRGTGAQGPTRARWIDKK